MHAAEMDTRPPCKTDPMRQINFAFVLCFFFFSYMSYHGCLFLHQEVDIVNAEGRQLLDGALKRHEKTTERNIGVSASINVSLLCPRRAQSGPLEKTHIVFPSYVSSNL